MVNNSPQKQKKRRSFWGYTKAAINVTLVAGAIAVIVTAEPEITRLEQELTTVQEENVQLRRALIEQSNFPDLTKLPVPQGTSFDYCTITQTSNAVDRLNAGEKIKPQPLFRGSLDSIVSMTLKEDNIVSPTGREPVNRYQVMLVGVGYQNGKLNTDLEAVVAFLARAYSGVNIDFSYLNVPVMIGIEHVERAPLLTNFKETRKLHEKLNGLTLVDSLIVVLNTAQSYGSSYERVGIVSGGSERRFGTAVHEVAHLLGLYDGYKRFYREEEFGESELFRTPEELKPYVLRATAAVHPPVGNTGNTCNDQPVFTFYPGESFNVVKSSRASPEQVEAGKPIFNQLQLQIIRNTIVETLSARPAK